MAAKKAKKKVTLSIDSETLEKLIDVHATLGDTQGLETFADDPDVAKRLTKRAGKKR
jgi:hypothetical protein